MASCAGEPGARMDGPHTLASSRPSLRGLQILLGMLPLLVRGPFGFDWWVLSQVSAFIMEKLGLTRVWKKGSLHSPKPLNPPTPP